jgi:carbonic anhydrase
MNKEGRKAEIDTPVFLLSCLPYSPIAFRDTGFSPMKFPALTVTVLLAVGMIAGCGDSEKPSPPPLRKPVAEAISRIHHYFHKDEQPHKADWGYTGEGSPEHWGDLSSEYVLAKTGKQQSPIDISGAVATDLPALEFAYHPSKIDLVYNGHTVEEVEDKKSSVKVHDEQFVLQQFHFHSPSEHTVDGKHSAIEMHLVHQSEGGKIAVVAVLIEEGEDNPAFDAVWDFLPNAANRERKSSTTIDAAALLPNSHQYYSYSGSFTTPPCTEDVSWMVLTTPVELSKDQIEKFRAVINGNNRPVQPLNGRTLSISD